MATVLMVAEKPSLAESLAKILSNNSSRSRKGMNGACSVHEYRSRFLNESNVRFKFTSVCGHVMTTDFPAQYNNWDRVEPIELYDAPVIKKEANPNLNMRKFLAKEASQCDYLVLWLDCDKEGENICFEVIDAVQESMRISFRQPQTVFRAKFSAITEKDIKHAMNSLILPNQLEAMSVDARQELDLRIGCSFTRFQTRFFHDKYGDLDSALISYGPCQTPTLGFCVDRHDKIQSFQPEPYWVLVVSVCKFDKDGNASRPLTLEWDRSREFNKNTAMGYLNHVKAKKKAIVVSVNIKSKTKQRPLALNTVELMRAASSGLAIGPHQAMVIAERLYMSGYISYPRTETTHYSANFNLIDTLKLLTPNNEWGQEASDLLKRGIGKARKGHDAGDHPPITPMKCGSRHEFHDNDSRRIFDYIVRHFIGTVSHDAVYEETTASFMIGEEKFNKTGVMVTDPGFTSVMPWLAVTKDCISSDIKVGDEFTVVELKLDERKTTPPDYLTESDLISLMEKHGIGTDASIPTHINNIAQRNYVKVSTGRRLVPTQLGIVLVHGYKKIDEDLVLPTQRCELEKRLNNIASGQVDFDSVMLQAIREFRAKFAFFNEHIQAMDELFEVSFSSLASTGKAISRCGNCRRYLKHITARPARLYCPACNETLTIPQGGNIKLFKEAKCPIDNFELLYYASDQARYRSYAFCPNCFNNPPFEDMKKLSGCNNCLDTECPQSPSLNSVNVCPQCRSNGLLVLDPFPSSGSWKINCNKCEYTMAGFKTAIRVAVNSDATCESCGSAKVNVEYRPEKTKLPDSLTTHEGCIYCDPIMGKLIDTTQRRQPDGGGQQYQRGNYQRGGRGQFQNGRGGRGARGARGPGRGRPARGGRGRGGRGRGRGRGGYDSDGDPIDHDYRAPRGGMQLSQFL